MADVLTGQKDLGKALVNQVVEDVNEKIICSICMDHPEDQGVLECSHTFCFECIIKWSKQENSCPLCKKEFKFVEKIPKKAPAGRRQLKRKRVEIKDKHQGGGSHYAPITLPRQNDGVALAGLLSAASRGDSSVLRGFLDLYSGGNSSHRNQQSIVEELIHLSNLRRISHDNIHSTRSTMSNRGLYNPDNYGLDLFDDYNIAPGSGIGSYNNGNGSGVNLPNRVPGHIPTQRDRVEFRSTATAVNHNAGFPTPRNYPLSLNRVPVPFSLQHQQQQQQQLVGGRSSSQAIDLCDDDSGFSVLSSSFPPRQHPSSSFRRLAGQGFGIERMPLVFGRHGCNSGNAHTQAVDLTDDVIDLREDSSVVREEDSSALGDVWAVSDTSSSSCTAAATSSSSVTSSLPMPLPPTSSVLLSECSSNTSPEHSLEEISDLGVLLQRSAS